jgi:hypothetical protein
MKVFPRLLLACGLRVVHEVKKVSMQRLWISLMWCHVILYIDTNVLEEAAAYTLLT